MYQASVKDRLSGLAPQEMRLRRKSGGRGGGRASIDVPSQAVQLDPAGRDAGLQGGRWVAALYQNVLGSCRKPRPSPEFKGFDPSGYYKHQDELGRSAQNADQQIMVKTANITPEQFARSGARRRAASH
jgi:hypothetical protein